MRKIISMGLALIILLSFSYEKISAEGQTQKRDVSDLLRVEKTLIMDGNAVPEDGQIDLTKEFSVNLKISVPVAGDNNGNHPDPSLYVQAGNVAKIEISENVIIPDSYNTEMYGAAVELSDGNTTNRLKVGTAKLIKEGEKVYAELTFDGDSHVFDGTLHSVVLQHVLGLKIDTDQVVEENNQRYITLFGKKIQIEEQERFQASKTGQLVKESKEIHWTIHLARKSKDGVNLDLAGYVLEEDFSHMPNATHGKLVRIRRNMGQVQETELNWDDSAGNGGRFRYTFPAGSQEEFEFKIVTKLTDLEFYLESIEGKKNEFRLYRPSGEEVYLKDQSEIVLIEKHDYIEKSSIQEFEAAGVQMATWAITINQDALALENVSIVDLLGEDIQFVSAQWQVGQPRMVNGEESWEYQNVGGAITNYPTGGEFVLGNIHQRHRLLITTSFDLKGQIAKVFANTATVKFGNGVAFSDTHHLLIGNKNVFTKRASKSYSASPYIEWNFNVKKEFLQSLSEPKVYDLFVFKSDIKLEHMMQEGKIKGLPQGIQMKDLLPTTLYYLKYHSVRNLDASLNLKTYPITYEDIHIADLVEVSGNRDIEWNYTLVSNPMAKDNISRNVDEYYGNIAMIFDGSQKLMASESSTRYDSLIMKKELIVPENIAKIQANPQVDLVNQIAAPTDFKGYHSKLGKILFRIDINANAHPNLKTALGNITLQDRLPEALFLDKVTDQDDFLIYRAKATMKIESSSSWTKETIQRVDAVGEKLSPQEMEQLGIEVTSNQTGIITFRFTKGLSEAYSIVVAARISPVKLPEYLKNGAEGKVSNMVRLYYQNDTTIPGIDNTSAAMLEWYRDVNIKINPLEKKALQPQELADRDGTIRWEVFANTYQVVTDYPAIKLQDRLGAGMTLKTDTIGDSKRPAYITLQEYEDEEDTEAEVILLEFGKNVHYDEAQAIMTVDLPRKDKRYRLDYTTVIRNDIVLAGTDLSNNVALVVENQNVSKKTAKYSVLDYDIKVEYQKNAWLDLFKTDNSKEKLPLKDAEFTLERLSTGEKVVKTSDVNGYIRFTQLKEGEYRLKETKAPEGYVLDDTAHRIVVRKKQGVVGVEVLVDGSLATSLHAVNKKPSIPMIPLVPYIPNEDQPKEEPKKPEPPKETIPMIPLVPATPIVPEKPSIPLTPYIPTPNNPEKPYIPADELEDGSTPYGDSNRPIPPKGTPEDGGPKEPLPENPFPFGNSELPKTGGVGTGNLLWLGSFLFALGFFTRKKK
ncbi:MAG: SpaA isopeptide-forming pilin-related protein [Eubacteriales bacterium]|nr:SpaA isopeptide-forming pilin-related protein [Eubacteriales bacterium]